MMVKWIFLSVSLLCAVGLQAQDLEQARKAYEKDKRNVQAVSAYVQALYGAQQRKLADSVARVYMSRCPVVQLEDKDTYLLLGKYLFEDVYSNAFDYGIFMMKRMRWGREASKPGEGKEAALQRFLKAVQGGGEDEIDKRYEVLSALSMNLKREIDRRCCPFYQKGKYVMPEYDPPKVAHLKYLLRKGEFIDGGVLQLKVAVYEDYVKGDYAGVLQKLHLACDLGLKDMGESYAMRFLSLLAERGAGRESLQSGIALLHRYADGRDAGEVNCYGVLGQLYTACGDKASGERYDRLGKEAEAGKMEIFGDWFKAFKDME